MGATSGLNIDLATLLKAKAGAWADYTMSGKGGEKPLVGIQPTAFMKIRDPKSGTDAAEAPRDPDAATPVPEPTKAPGALIRESVARKWKPHWTPSGPAQ